MKKNFLFLFISLALLGLSSYGQITFQKTYGDGRGYDIEMTNDGNYIMVGNIWNSTNTNSNISLIKINSIGDTIFTKSYGAGEGDFGICIRQTYDDGYIICGITDSIGAGGIDISLIKTDSIGNILWAKTYGGNGDEYGSEIIQTVDSGYIVIGATESFGAGNNDVYVIRTNINGDTLWTKTYGGVDNDAGYSIKETSNNGYIIAGTTKSFGTGNSDIYLLKINLYGDTIWTKAYGTSTAEQGFSIQNCNDGGFIIAGLTSFLGFGNCCLIKTDSSGNLAWSKVYQSGYSYCNQVKQTSDQGYILVGFTGAYTLNAYEGDIYFLKTDSNGTMLWSNSTGSHEVVLHYNEGISIQETADKGYIISGYLSLQNGDSICIIKTDSLGKIGCNEYNKTTIELNLPTQVSNTSTIVSSANSIVSDTSIIIAGTPYTVINFCIINGINEIKNQNSRIGIYPNPAHDNFTIFFNEQLKNAELKIFDVTGRVVQEQKINSQVSNVNFQLSAGVYFVKVEAGERVYAQKLVVE